MSKTLIGTIGIVLALVAFLTSCTTGVEPSPAPGIVRVMLKSSEKDTTLIIQNDTSRFSRWDTFFLYLLQGRVYRGDNYALIYGTPGIDRIPGDTVNIIAREWLNGTPITIQDTAQITTSNSRYRNYKVFESYVPPGTYDNLQFSLTGKEVLTYIPKIYQNPVQLPPDTNPAMDFPMALTVESGRVTEIDIEIYPYKSLTRYRDSFSFARICEVVRIQNL